MAPPRTPLVVLGPTASGKSDVATCFALETDGAEIVAVDAMQVYRGMDVGTAKPTGDDRRRVVHHGLDLVDPWDDFALPEYVDAVAPVVDGVVGRGGLPVLVAGTGLYLRALTDPMEIPGTWPDVRVELEARLELEGSAALHSELCVLDPLAASRMEPTNRRRVVRALEVCRGSGRPFSSFGPGLDAYPAIAHHQVGLRWDRAALAVRIEQRVHRMIGEGLVEEVARLLSAPFGLSRTARQALGYKEIIEHLEERCSLDAAVEQVIVRTRQFAVRQERWFRRDPRIHWVDLGDDPVQNPVPVVLTALRDWLQTCGSN